MNANHVIDAIGGTKATAELCELTLGAVSQWRTQGIPKPWKKYLKAVRPEAFVQSKQRKPA